jgi:FdhD protein
MENNITLRKIFKVSNQETIETEDQLATESPLEIQIVYGKQGSRVNKSISITMRTPGHDYDLAVGFLFTEGIINNYNEIQSVEHPSEILLADENNVIQVKLSENCKPDIQRLERHFYTSSSCGVCGKSSIEALKTVRMPKLIKSSPLVGKELIYGLPTILRNFQDVFEHTGGLHASAIFDINGKLILLREDVGRHNAVDKIAGAGLQKNTLPFDQHILLVSGRASFELIQKAAMIGVPIMAAVGAPSSLAVELAEETGITLIGFLRDHRFNIYTNHDRIV